MNTRWKKVRKQMIWNFLMLILLSACMSCSDEGSVEFLANGDHDAPAEYKTIVLAMGGSNDGGNAIEVILAFVPVLVSSTITWSKIEFGIHSVGLPKSPACAIADSTTLTSESGPFSLDVINDSNLSLKMLVPPAQEFCSMNFLLNTNAIAFHAEGLIDDGQQVVINTTFSGLFGFTSKEGRFRWETGDEYQWLAALDLDAMLPADLFGRLEPDEDGVLRIDSEHNTTFIVQIEESIAQAMTLIEDTNRNGVVDESERLEDSRVGNAGTCVDTCLENGGDERSCRERCFAPDDPTTDFRACYGECLESGGDESECRERCADAGENDRSCSDSANDAYESCIEGGEGEIVCRERAGAAYEECKEGRADGDQDRIDDSEDGRFQACYDECLAGGGIEEDCRERCASSR